MSDLKTRVADLETAVLALGANAEEFGDSEGHPFHGNQYQSGAGAVAADERHGEAPGFTDWMQRTQQVHDPQTAFDEKTLDEFRRQFAESRVAAPRTLMNDEARARAAANVDKPYPRGPKPQPLPGTDPLEDAPGTPAQQRMGRYHG